MILIEQSVKKQSKTNTQRQVRLCKATHTKDSMKMYSMRYKANETNVSN